MQRPAIAVAHPDQRHKIIAHVSDDGDEEIAGQLKQRAQVKPHNCGIDRIGTAGKVH